MATEWIRTHRLSLRPLEARDAPALHQVFSNPQAMRYFSDPHPELAETEIWVRNSLAGLPGQTLEFVLDHKGRVIGKAGIWDAPELGFLLHPRFWGKGLMAEALSALIPHFFQQMSLEKITADVDPRNSASLSLLNRMGFRKTHEARGTIRINGEWCDSIYLALPRPADPGAQTL
ncbi:GNAT family N-acetyltransferase [Sulfitobacter sp. BDSS02]|nr:GNAT family N-acetyltransferase [Sulfitobacter sp. BDSS02]MBR9849397.1 GNAT family N-acetyltransferase [Paracoccaceae bacterium]